MLTIHKLLNKKLQRLIVDFNLKELVRDYGFNLSANGSLDIKRYLIIQSAIKGEVSELLGFPESDLIKEIESIKANYDIRKRALIDAVRKI